MQLIQEVPGSVALSEFLEQEESHRKFSPDLKSILEVIAKTGKYWHDWAQLKILLSFRLKQVLKELQESRPNGVAEKMYYGCVKRLDGGLDSFADEAPFTLQRICELLLCPPSSYSNIDKFTLAFERLLLVTSTIDNSDDPYPAVTLPSDTETELKDFTLKDGESEALSDSKDSSATNPMDIDVKLPEAENNEVSVQRDSGMEASTDTDSITHVPEAELDTDQALESNTGSVLQESALLVEDSAPLLEESASLVEESGPLAEGSALLVEESGFLGNESASLVEESAPLADTLPSENIATAPADVASENRG
ncbi:hypothetical protein O6H91_21G043300 [Diphasiastrum complanatum]|nr:hypothetical protein O6H91_21G043300 [Diphasiastrum complanatum]